MILLILHYSLYEVYLQKIRNVDIVDFMLNFSNNTIPRKFCDSKVNQCDCHNSLHLRNNFPSITKTLKFESFEVLFLHFSFFCYISFNIRQK